MIVYFGDVDTRKWVPYLITLKFSLKHKAFKAFKYQSWFTTVCYTPNKKFLASCFRKGMKKHPAPKSDRASFCLVLQSNRAYVTGY
jgi:hypothetical protein